MKKNNPPRIKLEREEKELLTSFDKGEWRTVKKITMEKKRARKTASKTLSKDVRINIRLSSSDIANIKLMAAYQGLPYQTLISSILHKFAAGHLNHKIK
jgi:predicted DNA binding CopG/RHH family protein